MNENHTIEQLQAMSDGELAELTARLRGYKFDADTSELINESGRTESFGGFRVFKLRAKPYCENYERWNPPADIAQAYGLLRWARRYGLKFEITVDSFERIAVFPPRRSNFTIVGNDAREMVYAFVLAMQEVNNG